MTLIWTARQPYCSLGHPQSPLSASIEEARWKTKHSHSREGHVYTSAGVIPAYQPSPPPPNAPHFCLGGAGGICAFPLRPLHSPTLPFMAPLWPAPYPKTELKYFTPSPRVENSTPSLDSRPQVRHVGSSLTWLILIWIPLDQVRPGILRCWKDATNSGPLSSGFCGIRGMIRWPLVIFLASENQSLTFQFWNRNSWVDLSLGYHNLTQCSQII